MSFDSSIKLVEVGIVDYSYSWDFSYCEAEGNTKGREGVDKVRGAVYGVADECWVVCEFLAGVVGLFTDELEAWVGF